MDLCLQYEIILNYEVSFMSKKILLIVSRRGLL